MNLPHVMGHEFGGVVEEVGPGVKNIKAGDRVTVPFHMSCGACEYCYSGYSNLCLAFGVIGAHFFGGYGNLVAVPRADINLVSLPEEFDFLSAASLGCRYMTSYHGIVDKAQVRPGEWVAVFGTGGVGLAAVQIASALGARVIAVSRSDEKLEKAKAEGAVATVKASDDTTAEAIKDITHGGAHVAVDALGSSKTTLPGIMSLRKGGRHLQLGMTGQEDKGIISLPVDMMVFQEISFIGSLGCPVSSYPGLLSLVASGRLNPKKLVSNAVGVERASDVLSSMTDYNTVGFNVINSWN